MIKRLIAGIALLAALLLSSFPASATCVPGRIEVDPKTGTITIELPRCNPPPQR